jgi:hypothetical protein
LAPSSSGHTVRRTTPFEEEEEEDEEEEEFDSSNQQGNRVHSLNLPQAGQAAQGSGPKTGLPANVNEPRLTRAGRRKQIFESYKSSARMARKESGEEAGGVNRPSM